MILMNKVKTNQMDLEPCSYILLELGYQCQYILPIDHALQIVGILAGAMKLKDDYGSPKRIETANKFTMTYMTKTDINEILIKSGLQPEKET